MKRRHINIPIFIPHLGCPNDCVFCNQRIISGVKSFRADEVIPIIEEALATVGDDVFREIAFFGGSFTGIEPDLMQELLVIANRYLKQGRIDSIRCSTRPDYIYAEILEGLQELARQSGKEIWVELGLQSVYDETLEHIHRGHSYQQFCNAVAMIHEFAPSLKVGVHMILGLPGESIQMMIDGNLKLFQENKIDGVKYRMLDFTEGTEITQEYNDFPQRFVRFTDVTYVNLICDILERIPENVLIFRFANFKSLISTSTEEVSYTKGTVLRKVEKEFIARNTKQGSYFNS